MKHKSIVILGILLLSVGTLLASPKCQDDPGDLTAGLEQKITAAVLSSARYGVFDGVSFSVKDGKVILSGVVVMPITKEEIGRYVKKVDGIKKVTNNIEVLPLSGMDSAIREQLYNKLFSTADMYKYALGASPAIHIIVKGGRVSLEGTVFSKSDKKLALLASRGIPGVFSIENNLIVDK
jgi:osmotically-inducible protein OsmY